MSETKFGRLVAASRDTCNRYFIVANGGDDFVVERKRVPVFRGNFDDALAWLQRHRQGSGTREDRTR